MQRDFCSIIVSKYEKAGAAFITVDKDGNNTIVVAPGANHKLTMEDIKEKEKLLLNSDIVVLQMEIPVDTISYVISFAKEKDKLVVLNYAPAIKIRKEVLSKVDYLIMNEIEFQALTEKVFKFNNLIESVNSIRKFYGNALVVTLGEKGSIFSDSSGHIFEIPPYKVKSIDSTGAGDAFVGGFVLGLVQNKSIKECVKLGSAAGAISVTKLGAQSSLPNRSELKSFLKSYDENSKF